MGFMTDEEFKRVVIEVELKKELNQFYWSGYLHGIRRVYHGPNFGTEADHSNWMKADNDYGQGYRDAIFHYCK